MELRHLRYFLSVAAHGNVTRAAASLGMRQPPLSLQLRELERELGFALFRRLPRGVALTEAGAVFRDEADRLLAQLERAVSRGSQAAGGLAGRVAIGFTSSAAAHRLAPALVRQFRSDYPAVELVFHEGNAAAITESVASGRLDAGLLRRPVSEQSGLVYHPVAEEPLLIALPRRHPVAARAIARGSERVRLRDLAGEGFILVRRPGAPGMYGDLIAACHAVGFAPRVVAEVEQMLTNLTLVAAGVGVSAVPASMSQFHRDDVFYARASDAPGLSAPLSLVTRLGETNPAVENLVRLAATIDAASAPRPRRPPSAATRAGASPRSTRRGPAPARRP